MMLQRYVYDFLSNMDGFNLDEAPVHALNLEIDKEYNSVLITGNRKGLIFLADYIVSCAISLTPTHVHLDDQFFDEANGELIIDFQEIHSKYAVE